jgi:membrane associated rhomboid family serine protease
MPRPGASSISFPAFRGTTRRLILANLIAYFALLLTGALSRSAAEWMVGVFAFIPGFFLHGSLWQPLTYSFIHQGILGTALELLSLWFLAGFLEPMHNSSWVAGLYGSSVIGTALAAAVIFIVCGTFGFLLPLIPLYGCFGGIFGLLVAFGVLYGDMEFMMFPLPISIKARYLAIIYALIAVAMMFGEQRMYAFAQLGGGLAGMLFIRFAPRRGISFVFSEQWYGLRNRYYRWKRRRAARKFEVYMRSQGRTVRFDGSGKQIDEDSNDKKRWN